MTAKTILAKILININDGYSLDELKEYCNNELEKLQSADRASGQAETQVMPKIADTKEKEGIRRLAEITYSQLAVEFMVMAGYKREKVEYLKSLYARKEGFDVEDMQIIPIIEKALWEAKNSNFSA